MHLALELFGPVDDGNGAAEVISVDQCDDVLHVL